MELDKEEILNELMNFEKNYGRDCESGLPDCLERYLVNIAKSGDTIYPWNKIKPVILKKIELVVNEFNTKYPYENNPVLPNVKPFNFQEMKDEIIEKFDYFYGAPFTIQRICELLTAPFKYYKRSDKFMRGLEKNVRVITTVEARRADIENEPNSFPKEFSRSPKSNTSPSSSSSNILLPSSLPSSSSSTSSASSSSSPSSSAFVNGLNVKEDLSSAVLSISNRMSQSCSPIQDQGPLPNSPAPLQQLDSFTTVFASPPSTPLAVVSDMHRYDVPGSPSSSSSSSSESSPSSSSSPPLSLASDSHELNQSIDAEYEDSKLKEEELNENKSDSSTEQSSKSIEEPLDIGEPMDQTEEGKFEETQEKLEIEEDLIKPDKSTTEDVLVKVDSSPTYSTVKEVKQSTDTQFQIDDPSNIPSISSMVEKKISETFRSNETSLENDPECVQKSPTSDMKYQNSDELIESTELQQTNKVELVEPVSEKAAESISDSVKPSGQIAQSDEIKGNNFKPSGGDIPRDGNDSSKANQQQRETETKEDLIEDLETISSGSSTVSENGTADSCAALSNPQPYINEESESQ